MGALTTDPNDPRLGHGGDDKPVEQNAAYLILSEAERAKGFVRPVRDTYMHTECSQGLNPRTTMSLPLAETYAREPNFYGATYCCACRMHRPVREFIWLDGSRVGS